MKTVRELYKNHHKVLEEGFSIEVEAELQGYDPTLDKLEAFSVKRDGSLLGNGYELYSRKVLTRPDLVKALDKEIFTEKFSKSYKKSQRTSTHVHVNMQNRTKEELFTVLAVYYLTEHLLFRFVEDHRRDNLFCLPMYSAEYNGECLQNLWDERPGKLLDNFKYSALNVSTLYSFGTLEFRHLEGTTDIKKIDTWLGLIEKITGSYHDFRSVKDVYETYKVGREDFFRRVFGDLWKSIPDGDDDEKADLNFSKVFDILDYQTKPKKEVQSYLFAEARALDDLEFNIYSIPNPYRTKPMEL